MSEQRGFKGIWIPAEIWLSESLTLQEKVFLVEIDSLDNDNGCFASNDHFADFFKLSKTRCSEVINSLEKKGFIEINYIYKPGTKAVDKRIIKIKTTSSTPIRETEGGIRNVEGGYSENCKGNNTYINNTINKRTTTNINNINKIDQEPKQPEKSSSSVSGEIREIKKALTESGLEIPTCKNIMSLVLDNKIDLNRIKEVLAYAKTKGWEDGAIYKALNENWNVKEFKSQDAKSAPKRATPANTFNPEAKKQADEDFTKTLEERVPTAEEIERAKELCRINGIFAPKMPTVLARTYLKKFGEWRD